MALPVEAFAERLPVRIYTTADGLAGDRVSRIFRDSRGFLWFCATGLSRFDGVRFTNYTTADGLSRMAILAEVARRQLQTPDTKTTSILADVADSARDLVSSMSDIVWSVDPRRDDLASVIQRVREFASSLLEAKGIVWRLEAPADAERIKLTPEQRRDLFLVIKEALNNAVHHADCRTVRLLVRADRGGLIAEIADDGGGFENLITGATPAPMQQAGYGLRSMSARAARSGGKLTMISAPGHGTCVQLAMPVRRRMA